MKTPELPWFLLGSLAAVGRPALLGPLHGSRDCGSGHEKVSWKPPFETLVGGPASCLGFGLLHHKCKQPGDNQQENLETHARNRATARELNSDAFNSFNHLWRCSVISFGLLREGMQQEIQSGKLCLSKQKLMVPRFCSKRF